MRRAVRKCALRSVVPCAMGGARTRLWRGGWARQVVVPAVVGCLASLVVAAAAEGNEDEDASFWLYVSIPIVSALVGWGTNVVALKMYGHIRSVAAVAARCCAR